MQNKPMVSANEIGKTKIEIQIRGPLTKLRWIFEWLRNGDNRSKRKRIFGLSTCQSAIALTLEVYYPLTFQFWLKMVFGRVCGWLENKSPTFDGNLLRPMADIDWSLIFYWVIDTKRNISEPSQNNRFNYNGPNCRNWICNSKKFKAPSRWSSALKNIIRQWNMDFPRCLHARLQIDSDFNFVWSSTLALLQLNKKRNVRLPFLGFLSRCFQCFV